MTTDPLPAQAAPRRDALRLPIVPAAFFGMVLGLAGLAVAWRAAHQVWGLPAAVGEAIAAVAILVWLGLAVLYAGKWFLARPDVVAEAEHPVQCCFIGLVGVATMLVAGLVLPYVAALAAVLFVAGAVFTLGFAVWRTGGLWQGARDPATTTPVLYLPTVAGSFVLATAAALLGYPDWGQIAFGCGFFSWLAIESVLVHRLLTAPAMAPALRPTLGVQLAPAPVCAVSYLSVTAGPPDLFAHALIGYGLLQLLILVRLVPWIRQQPFAPSYWAFTFGATALATAPLRLIAHGDGGPAAVLAPVLFVLANLLVAAIALGTLRLALAGRLIERSVALGRGRLASPAA